MLRALLHRPRLTLAILASAVGLALAGLPRLRVDFTPRDLYGRANEPARVTDQISATFGSRDNVVLILVAAPDVLSQPILQYTHDLSLYLRTQKYSARVDGITTMRFPRRVRPPGRPGVAADTDPKELVRHFMEATARGEVRIDSVVEGADVDAEEAAQLRVVLEDAPMVEGRLVSRDRRVSAVAVALDRKVERIGDVEGVVSDIDGWLRAHPPPAGAETLVTGQPHANADFARRIRADQSRLMPLSVLVCAAVLWFIFGSATGVLLPLSAVLLSAGVLLGGMGWVGEPLNILNNITPLLVIVLGLSDSIHLLEHYSVERASGGDARAVVARTVASLTIACFLTSLTDAIGFGSLWVANTPLLARFGITAAVGVMIAYFVTVAFVPAWLTLRAPALRADRRAAARVASRLGVALVPSSRRARWLLLIVSGIAVAASSLAATRARVDTTVLGLFASDDPMYRATKLAQDELSGVSPLEILLESPTPGRFRSVEVLAAIDAARAAIQARDGVLRVSSYSDDLHQVWAVLAEDVGKRRTPFVSQEQVDAFDRLLRGSDPGIARGYVSDDGTRSRLTIELADIGSRAVSSLSEEVRQILARELSGVSDVAFRLGGDAYVNAVGTDTLMRDLLGSFGQATLGIGVSLLLLTRNVAAIIVGVLATVLPQDRKSVV